MKKAILILVSIAMIVGLVGCTAPTDTVGEDNDNSTTETKLYQGFGLSNLQRVGPGKDDTGTQVYSINQVFANVMFDEED